MTLQELESLKQDRLTNQQAWLQAAQVNDARAKVCVERFRAAGFQAMTCRSWTLFIPHLYASAVEEAGQIYVEHNKIPLAEAERLVAELARQGKTEE